MRTSKFAVPPRALRGSVVLICIAMALVVAASAAARTNTASSTARQADAKSWCKAVIDANTKAGTMKNKRFVSFATVPLSAYKKIVNEAVANGGKYIALAPGSIKTAVTHQIAYFKNIKAHNYSKTTPLAPMTLADVKKITDFERTQCGIKFST